MPPSYNHFYTADTHFCHKNIIKYYNRPYETVEVMNETMIKVWNETVTPNDVVTILGNFGMSTHKGTEYINELISIWDRLNGIKRLIPGNRDGYSFIKALKKAHGINATILPDPYFGKVSYDGDEIKVAMSHKQIDLNNAFWPYVIDDCEIQLHGHTHSTLQHNPCKYDVGWDIFHKPVTLEEIIKHYTLNVN